MTWWQPTLLMMVFFILILLPFFPGLIELRSPKDDLPLRIDMEYIRDPRYFALAFRQRVQENLTREAQGGPGARPRLQPMVTLGPGTNTSGTIMALDHIEVGRGSKLGDAYSYGDLRIAEQSEIESAAADGSLLIESDSVIRGWIDSEGDATVGNGVNLGVSASSASTLTIGERCEFQRLWGLPVRTSEEPVSRYVPDFPRDREEIIGKDSGVEIEDAARWSSRDMTIPAGSTVGRDLVAYGDVRIGANSIVLGTVKSRGVVTLDEGVIIEGSVIGQRGVNCIGNATIFGNVFSSRDVELGPGTVVGRPQAFKTVFSQTRVLLARGVEVFGWIVSEEGGTVG
ncbi:MAG: hypothetical protein KIS66_14890 [Fimbriimonadaceae bacterium]|nr:hypothetical protein [Fimbriimonadaceae bacterium]